MFHTSCSSLISILIVLMGYYAPCSSSAQEIKEGKTYTIAVLDMEAREVSESTVKSLTDVLRYQIAQLVQSEEYQSKKDAARYQLIERSEMEKILDEFKIESVGCVSDSCAVEFGKILQMDRMIVGSIGLVGQTYTVSVRMIDVETSKTIAIANRNTKGFVDDILSTLIPEVARDLFLGKANDRIIRERQLSAIEIKNPRSAFIYSLLLPGAGQVYAESSNMKVIGFFTVAVFPWTMTIVGITEWKKEKQNADHLYSLDPTGINPDFTIYDDYDKTYKTGSAWRAQEESSVTLIYVFSVISCAINTWAAFDASKQAKQYNKKQEISINSDPVNKAITVAYNKSF